MLDNGNHRRDNLATGRRSVAWPPRRIGVLRALNLGDLLCAVPAFRAIRAAFPRSRITLIGLPWARDFTRRYRGYFDDFLELPGYPGFPEHPVDTVRIPGFLREAQVRRFDLAIQMHGAGAISNPLTMQFDAFQTAGFFQPGQYCPDPELFFPYPDELPEVHRHLALLSFLGIRPISDHLEFPLEARDFRDLELAVPGEPLARGAFACLHPGGRKYQRRWPAEHFARVGDWLAQCGLRVVLTGTSEESELVQTVAGQMTAPSLDLSGRTTLGSVGALLHGAALLVSNDTGVAHLAQAVGTPSIVLFAAGEVGRWGPLDRERHRALAPVERVPAASVVREAEALLGISPIRGRAVHFSAPRAAAAMAD